MGCEYILIIKTIPIVMETAAPISASSSQLLIYPMIGLSGLLISALGYHNVTHENTYKNKIKQE